MQDNISLNEHNQNHHNSMCSKSMKMPCIESQELYEQFVVYDILVSSYNTNLSQINPVCLNKLNEKLF